jgi:hypothetical protein
MTKEKPRIGGIGQQRQQYGTIGGGKSQEQTLERSDVQESERLGTETPERLNVQGEERSGVETSKRLDTQASERTGKRERHTIYLPPALSEWVRVQAARTRREISELATEALERYRSEVEGHQSS